MPPEGFEHAFAQDAAPEMKSVLLATQRPINVEVHSGESSPAALEGQAGRGSSSPRMIE